MRLKEDSNGYYLSLFLRENDLTPTSFFQKRGNKKIKIKNGKNKLTCQVLVGVSKSLFGKIEYTITNDTNDLSDKNSLSILISCLVEKNLDLSSQVISNEGQFVFPEGCRILDSGNWSLFLGIRTCLKTKFNLNDIAT